MLFSKVDSSLVVFTLLDAFGWFKLLPDTRCHAGSGVYNGSKGQASGSNSACQACDPGVVKILL